METKHILTSTLLFMALIRTAAGADFPITDSIVHLAGYGSVTYSDSDKGKGSFSGVQFSPIFHYQYRDLMMLGSELEIVIEPGSGETVMEMEYLATNLLINDYMVLVGGKFLSPIGQFRQNLHPSWINKLPDHPVGFGHDGAAPVSDVGLQLRGGLPPMGNASFNYAVYVSNGPELTAEIEEGEEEGELEAIEAEGIAGDADGKKVFGGRFGVLPIPQLEIAASFATGEATITGFEDAEGDLPDLSGEPSRGYTVLGGDFSLNYSGLSLRGEYVKSKVDAQSGSIAPEGAEWKVWYLQGSYKFLPTKWESVLRYTDFNSPHASESQKQWAFGINYLFATTVQMKAAYQSNQRTAGQADDNKVLFQIAYGF